MISVNNVTVTFSGTDLFSEISFVINPRDRVGLAGKNGAGKSTLLKVIIGQQALDKGSITIPSGIKLGYLPQQMVLPQGKTVMDETLTAFSEVKTLESRIKQINNEIASRTDYHTDSYLDLIHELTEISERFDMVGGHKIHAEVEQTLKGLGFASTDFNRPTSEFSGGWKMRIELAKLLLQKPDVFLLDEPTNHLDIESIQWLEEFLANYQGAVVLISHDRVFLDTITKRTVEISLGKIYDYNAPYSQYLILRQERMDQQIAAYNNQQKMINDTEKFIERFRYKATKSVQVQSRIKQLDKVERIEIDETDKSSIHFRFPAAPRAGSIVIEAENLSLGYGKGNILENVNFILERGEKIAFVGRNGEGKSTFAKAVLGQLKPEGLLKIGHNVSIGYYAQNQDELLDMNKTVFQTLDEVAIGDIRTKLRDILGSFLFTGENIDKKVMVLSGGERARLALAKLLLQPYSLLLLDEPTNHLDIKSKDILKSALMHYDGTIILVSHDRDFLQGLASTVYEFKNKQVKQFKGDIQYFLQKKRLESLSEIEKKESRQKEKTEISNTLTTDTKQQYLNKKENEKIVRKAKQLVEKSEEQIALLEQKIADLHKKLEIPENATNQQLFDALQAANIQLEKEIEQWEMNHLEYEKLIN